MSDGSDKDLRLELDRLRRENERLSGLLDQAAAAGGGSDGIEAQFGAAVATLPYLFFLIGADDSFLAFRAGHHAVPYMSPELFLGRPIGDVIPEPARTQLLEGVRRVRESGRQVVLEYGLPTPGGDDWFEARMVPLSGGRVATLVNGITERKRAEAALRASEARFRTIFQAEPECVTVIARDGCLLEMNPAGLAMLELGSVAEAGALADFVHPDDRAAFIDLHRRVMRGEQGTLSFRIIGRKGTERWADSVAAPLRDANGEVIALIGVTRDVTERRRGEQALREAKERFQAISEAMPIPVLITRETDGRVLYGNSLLAEMFEVPHDQITAKYTQDFYVSSSTRGHVLERLEQVSAISDFEVQVRTARGRLFWASFSAQRVSFDGEPAVLAGLIDMSDRKRAEEMLRTSEQLYRVLFEANPLPAGVFDIETLEFLEVNDAAVRHYGYSREEFGRMKVHDLRPPEDLPAFERQIARWKRDAGPGMQLARHRKKDGSIIQVELTGRSIVFRGCPARLVMIHDVTEQMRLQEQLNRAQKLESIGRLAGGVAHDFNNLLTAILGYTQILETRMTADPGALEDLAEIRHAGTRARDLTQQLLAVARRQVTAPRVVDLNAVVSEIERLLQRVMAEDIELVTRLGHGLWPTRADPAQIEQVLMNLAVNARDAMPDGGMLTIETDNLTVPSASSGGPPGLEPGDYVRLRVRDTGAGMPEEVLAHVFEPFFTTKPVGQGTGLGLATVYGAVRQGGGHIWVDSAPGQGTTFTVCFPRSRGRVSRARREHGPDAGGGHENVLVVEDHPSVRALAMNVLRKAGYAVRAAGNGPEALRMVEREPGAIDLLVTDVVMPHMSGKEVAERLARERPGMRVLYVSGYPRGTGDHRVALQPGDEFLPKPFTGPQLLGKVREVLDRAAPR